MSYFRFPSFWYELQWWPHVFAWYHMTILPFVLLAENRSVLKWNSVQLFTVKCHVVISDTQCVAVVSLVNALGRTVQCALLIIRFLMKHTPRVLVVLANLYLIGLACSATYWQICSLEQGEAISDELSFRSDRGSYVWKSSHVKISNSLPICLHFHSFTPSCHPSIHPFTHLSRHPFFYLFIYPSVHPSVYQLVYRSIRLFTYLSEHPFFLPSIDPSIHLSFSPLSFLPYTYPSVYMPIFLPILPSIYPPIHLFLHTSVQLPNCLHSHPFIHPSIHLSTHSFTKKTL